MRLIHASLPSLVQTRLRVDDSLALRTATWRDCFFFRKLHGGIRMIPHLFWFWEQLTRGWGCWVIFDRRSNESLGYLRQDDDRQLSIAIAPRRQQFGYGTRVLTWAARHLDAWARVERSNAPSRKAFERSGWILAGLVGPYVLYKTRFHGTIEGQPGMATDDPSKRHL